MYFLFMAGADKAIFINYLTVALHFDPQDF